MKKCIVFGAGEYRGECTSAPPGAFVIAADGGLEYCRKEGITPDIIIGDFDSLGYLPPDENVICLPCEKDVTDTEAAVNEGIKRGCGDFTLYGCSGGRPDHSMAAYALLASLSMRGYAVRSIGCGFTVYALSDGEILLNGKKGNTVSVFSFTDKSDGVNLEGLKYPLTDAVLHSSYALGVSNEFEENTARISVKNGTLLVFAQND